MFGVFGRDTIGIAVKEYFVFLWLSEEEQITESAVANAVYGDAKRPLEQIRKLATHHIAARVVLKVALPVLQLSWAHKDMVVVVRLEERGFGFCG